VRRNELILFPVTSIL